MEHVVGLVSQKNMLPVGDATLAWSRMIYLPTLSPLLPTEVRVILVVPCVNPAVQVAAFEPPGWTVDAPEYVFESDVKQTMAEHAPPEYPPAGTTKRVWFAPEPLRVTFDFRLIDAVML